MNGNREVIQMHHRAARPFDGIWDLRFGQLATSSYVVEALINRPTSEYRKTWAFRSLEDKNVQ